MAKANPYDHQKCACGHAWDVHEGSGEHCAHVDPPTTEGGEPHPCGCAKWDGQPFTLPDEDDDEPDGDGSDESSGGESGGGDEPDDDEHQP